MQTSGAADTVSTVTVDRMIFEISSIKTESKEKRGGKL